MKILLQEFHNKSNNVKIISLLKEHLKLELNWTDCALQSKWINETRGKNIPTHYELDHDVSRMGNVTVKDITMELNLLIDDASLIYDDC